MVEALPQDPTQAGQQGKPAIVMRDAGSANHIIGWLRSWDGVAVYAEGPAAEIASREGISIAATLEETVRRSDWLLVGTGGDPLSQEAMKLGKGLGRPVLAVVDHWTNYRERFSGVHGSHKPDAIIVTDQHAYELAGQELPWAKILVWPNHMLEDLRSALRSRPVSKLERQRLLLLSEPIRNSSSNSRESPPDTALTQIDDVLVELGLAPCSTDVVLRLHPSETGEDLEWWRNAIGSRATVESPVNTPIGSALAASDVVVGVTTYALYLSWAAGHPTFSLSQSIGLLDPFPVGSVPQLLLQCQLRA